MILMESKSLNYRVTEAWRTPLLEKLQEAGWTPLIRTARLRAYELTLPGGECAREMERALAARADVNSPYVRGDLFCAGGEMYFLVFADEAAAGTAAEVDGVRAGVMYESGNGVPVAKFEEFCRSVRDSLLALEREGGGGVGAVYSMWRSRALAAHEGFARFIAAQTESGEEDAASCGGTGLGAHGITARAAEVLGEEAARRLLRDLSAPDAGGASNFEYLGIGGRDEATEYLLRRLAGANLIRMEVSVSCRKAGRALFRLPSADAFAVLGASGAVCSGCGTNIADEQAEEVAVPTPLAASVLQDATWLAAQVRALLVGQLGVPEAQVASGRAISSGAWPLAARVGGAFFLVLACDGDWTAVEARRALEACERFAPTHLALVATGEVHDEVRAPLREYARRRAHGAAGELTLILAGGLNEAAAQLETAFAEAARQALDADLWELDASLGLNVAGMVAARFRLLHRAEGLPEFAAAGAFGDNS